MTGKQFHTWYENLPIFPSVHRDLAQYLLLKSMMVDMEKSLSDIRADVMRVCYEILGTHS